MVVALRVYGVLNSCVVFDPDGNTQCEYIEYLSIQFYPNVNEHDMPVYIN